MRITFACSHWVLDEAAGTTVSYTSASNLLGVIQGGDERELRLVSGILSRDLIHFVPFHRFLNCCLFQKRGISDSTKFVGFVLGPSVVVVGGKAW